MKKSIMALILLYLLSGCASQNGMALKSENIKTEKSEWNKGFVSIPLKIDRSAPQYQIAKKKILKLLENEALRDRQSRVAYVQDTSNLDSYCHQIAISVGNPAYYSEKFRACKQAQHQSDLKSLQSPVGKHFKEKRDAVSHYAHFQWNLITKCGTKRKDTTRDLYYGFVEPKDGASEVYFFTSYRTKNECEAVYERLRRKLQIVERKTIKILKMHQVGFSRIK